MPVRLTPRTLTLPRRLAVVAAALLALAAALAGCTTLEKARSAAIVNGTSISQAEVTEVTTAVNQYLVSPGGTPISESDTVRTLILAPFVLNEVRKSGSWAPDARYNALVARIPGASRATQDFLATSVVLEQGGPLTQNDANAILDELKKANIQVDPRYGTFDPNTGGLVAPENNWIRPTAPPGADGTSTGSPSPTETETQGPSATPGTTTTAP
jgi:hypothetical protein